MGGVGAEAGGDPAGGSSESLRWELSGFHVSGLCEMGARLVALGKESGMSCILPRKILTHLPKIWALFTPAQY